MGDENPPYVTLFKSFTQKGWCVVAYMEYQGDEYIIKKSVRQKYDTAVRTAADWANQHHCEIR